MIGEINSSDLRKAHAESQGENKVNLQNRLIKTFLLSSTIFFIIKSHAQPTKDYFDRDSMSFVGSPLDQAKLLLRTIKSFGIVQWPKASIMHPLDTLLGSKVNIDITAFRKFLIDNKIDEDSIGGSLNDPLSFIIHGSKKNYAKYFVIHDVSSPEYNLMDFPENINEESWESNNLNRWSKRKTHVYISRTGRSKTAATFKEGLRATKFELDTLGQSCRGLFIHIELIQPRKKHPAHPNRYNAIGPTPGFTEFQYERLAIIYVAVSIRKGEWLIPAFHGCLDEMIHNGHDDPQNFELGKFIEAIDNVLSSLRSVR